MNNLKISNRIKQARIDMGYSQSEAANVLGVSQATYSRLEMGLGELKVETINKVAEKFNVNLHWLLYGEIENVGPENHIILPDDLTKRIKSAALRNKRSLQQEVISALEEKYPTAEIVFSIVLENIIDRFYLYTQILEDDKSTFDEREDARKELVQLQYDYEAFRNFSILDNSQLSLKFQRKYEEVHQLISNIDAILMDNEENVDDEDE